MPNASLTPSSNSSILNASSGSAIDGIGAAAPVLQGVMEGLGWHDERAEIIARDQAAALIAGQLRQAATAYEADPTPARRTIFITTLEQELAAVRAEHHYAQEQWRQHQATAEREAKAQGARSQGWGEWAISGVKSFFGSTAEQQAEKYAEVAASRQARIKQLQAVLTSLNEAAVEREAVAVDDASPRALPSHVEVLAAQEVVEASLMPEESIAAEHVQLDDEDVIELDTRDGERISREGNYHHSRHLLTYPLTDEFRVNTYTTDSPRYPSVATLSSGDFVVVWQNRDGNLDGVYAQRYSVSGVAQGAEFRVNTYTSNHQILPSIAALTSGDFVVTWMSSGQDGYSYGIYAQRYSASAVAQGAEFRVNTYTTFSQELPSIATLSSGDFVVAWHSIQDAYLYGVYAQRYSVSGMAQGAEFQVNTYKNGSQTYPSIAALTSGDFVVAWGSDGQDGSSSGIYAQRYSATGVAQGSEFRVNTYTVNSQSSSSIVALTSGDFVVAWESYGQDGYPHWIYAQRYSATGVAQGNEFQVNTYTVDYQSSPSIATLTSGDFVVVWRSDSFGSDHNGMYAQRYSVSGVAQGAEFRVNRYTNDGYSHSIAALSSGGFVVLGLSYSGNSDLDGVYARLFSINNLAPILGQNQLTLNKGGTLIITSSFLSATDDIDTDPQTLNFIISNVQHGRFELITNPGVAITQFTQGQVQAGQVRFVHDGSDTLPSYEVSVSDGVLITIPQPASTSFRSNPTSPTALIAGLVVGLGVGGVAGLVGLLGLHRYIQKRRREISEDKAAKQSALAKAEVAVNIPSHSPKAIELRTFSASEPSSVGSAVVTASSLSQSQPITNNSQASLSKGSSVSAPIVEVAPLPAFVHQAKELKSLQIPAMVPDQDNPSIPSAVALAESKSGFSIIPAYEHSLNLPHSPSRPNSPSSPHQLDEAGELKISFNIPFSDLDFDPADPKNKLGSGGYGTVYQGSYKFNDVAIKKLHAEHFSEAALVELRKEAGVMASMRSNYLVKLLGVSLESPHFCLVMELMPKGSLYGLLRNNPELPLSVTYRIALDVGYGLYHLHEAQILHRDLKSLNVLLDDRLRAKITDFGLAKIKSEVGSMSSTKAMKGTLGWMAPELFSEEPKASEASDMYAYGMVLWELATKPYRMPFQGLAPAQLITAKLTRGTKQEKIPEDCPAEFSQLMSSCWQAPERRPPAKLVAQSLSKLFSAVASAPAAVAKKAEQVVAEEAISVVPGYAVHSFS